MVHFGHDVPGALVVHPPDALVPLEQQPTRALRDLAGERHVRREGARGIGPARRHDPQSTVSTRGVVPSDATTASKDTVALPPTIGLWT